MSTQSAIVEGMVKYIDPSKHSAAYKLFHYPIVCVVAHMHLTTQEHTDIGGYVTSGDSKIDRAQALADAHVQLTVAAMAEFHDQGIAMRLATPEDSVRIYQMIHEHLMDWRRVLETEATTQVPLEDLKKFDALAGEVYQIARYYMTTAPTHGQLERTLTSLLQNRGRVRRSADPNAPTFVRNVPQGHTPMADAMAREVAHRRREWH